jgi:hypothetical protein
MTQYVFIDFYNNGASCRIDDVVHAFSSADTFKYGAGFPYSETMQLVSYEPGRGIYVVEFVGGRNESGQDLHAMVWIKENLDKIKAAAIQDLAEHPPYPPLTLATLRNSKLYDTDWVLQRKQEEDLLSLPNTMSEDKFAAVLAYRQALRDITKTYSDIKTVVWPTDPLS